MDTIGASDMSLSAAEKWKNKLLKETQSCKVLTRMDECYLYRSLYIFLYVFSLYRGCYVNRLHLSYIFVSDISGIV